MTTTVKAIYREGVLKLRRLLPLRPDSEVLVTVELPPGVADDTERATDGSVEWPDITARLRSVFGDKVLPENAVLTARGEERY